jgi:hypothetical protein
MCALPGSPASFGLASLTLFFYLALVVAAAPAIFWLRFYIEPLTPSPSGCRALSFVAKTASCVLPGASATTICNTCAWRVALTTQEGLAVVTYTEYPPVSTGYFAAAAERDAYCQGRIADSQARPMQCWYRPGSDKRLPFYVALSTPTYSPNVGAIGVFFSLVVLFCIGTVITQVASAPPDPRIQRVYELARERAVEENMSMALWSAMPPPGDTEGLFAPGAGRGGDGAVVSTSNPMRRA